MDLTIYAGGIDKISELTDLEFIFFAEVVGRDFPGLDIPPNGCSLEYVGSRKLL